MGLGTGGNDGDGDGDGPRGQRNGGAVNEQNCNNGGTRTNEFTFANPRNIIAEAFARKNLHTNPDLPFNNALGRLILVQSSDGEMLLQIFDKIEALGATKHINEQLRMMIDKYPKETKFDTTVKSALLNWTAGIINNVVECGVHKGSNAWRKLCHRYVPFAKDLQNKFIQELMALNPISENEADSVFI